VGLAWVPLAAQIGCPTAWEVDARLPAPAERCSDCDEAEDEVGYAQDFGQKRCTLDSGKEWAAL